MKFSVPCGCIVHLCLTWSVSLINIECEAEILNNFFPVNLNFIYKFVFYSFLGHFVSYFSLYLLVLH